MAQVTLRPMGPEDTRQIVAWRNKDSVRRHFIHQQALTEAEHTKWYETRVKTGLVDQFVILCGGEAVGSVYLRDIDIANRKAEFGIFIGEDMARGKGVGTAAAKQILTHAFKKRGLNRVFLRVYADNLPAIASYRKAGFAEEGVFRQDVIVGGVPRDMMFMAILRQEWGNC